MRKRYKKKRRSCSVCKPHRRGITMRWSGREEQRLKDWERERRRGWFELN